jgi:hypothetical protein
MIKNKDDVFKYKRFLEVLLGVIVLYENNRLQYRISLFSIKEIKKLSKYENLLIFLACFSILTYGFSSAEAFYLIINQYVIIHV